MKRRGSNASNISAVSTGGVYVPTEINANQIVRRKSMSSMHSGQVPNFRPNPYNVNNTVLVPKRNSFDMSNMRKYSDGNYNQNNGNSNNDHDKYLNNINYNLNLQSSLQSNSVNTRNFTDNRIKQTTNTTQNSNSNQTSNSTSSTNQNFNTDQNKIENVNSNQNGNDSIIVNGNQNNGNQKSNGTSTHLTSTQRNSTGNQINNPNINQNGNIQTQTDLKSQRRKSLGSSGAKVTGGVKGFDENSNKQIKQLISSAINNIINK